MSLPNGVMYSSAVPVTPHATNPNSYKGFIVAVAGDVTFRSPGASADVTITCAAGHIYPVMTSFIRAALTTATGIVGFN